MASQTECMQNQPAVMRKSPKAWNYERWENPYSSSQKNKVWFAVIPIVPPILITIHRILAFTFTILKSHLDYLQVEIHDTHGRVPFPSCCWFFLGEIPREGETHRGSHIPTPTAQQKAWCGSSAWQAPLPLPGPTHLPGIICCCELSDRVPVSPQCQSWCSSYTWHPPPPQSMQFLGCHAAPTAPGVVPGLQNLHRRAELPGCCATNTKFSMAPSLHHSQHQDQGRSIFCTCTENIFLMGGDLILGF